VAVSILRDSEEKRQNAVNPVSSGGAPELLIQEILRWKMPEQKVCLLSLSLPQAATVESL